jgi:hypothetical protein
MTDVGRGEVGSGVATSPVFVPRRARCVCGATSRVSSPNARSPRKHSSRRSATGPPSLECPRIVATDVNDFICKILLLRARGKGDGFPVCLRRGKELGLREDELGMRVHRHVREKALPPACRGRRRGMRVLWVKPINPR